MNSPGRPVGTFEGCVLGVVDPLPEVEAPMAAAFQAAVSRLRHAGVATRPLDISGMLARLDAASHTVMSYEGARFHQQRYEEHGSRLGELADLVRAGLGMPESQYDEARREIALGAKALDVDRGRPPPVRLPSAWPRPAIPG